ncbi:MAG: gliding motility-associated C-terminal domain-containing protein, partial [Bacteroidia bacterium]|nr:gliding motility-associated C-terminal domain-containing protein [Bacteroidia bacterium]
KQFITDEKVRWSFDPGVNYGFKTFNLFSHLGPHLITATLSHVCGPYVLRDTVNIIGPLAIIEPDFILPNERYQCSATDSVHVTDRSLYYHNDSNMLDEDSMSSQVPGNFKFVMRLNPQTGRIEPFYPYNYDRDKDNVDRLWDFGDTYCLPCTTDRVANLNLGMNCRYSKDTIDVHSYTDWDSIYRYLYVKRSVNQAYFDRTQSRCGSRKIWYSDSLYALLDTFLYYGNNPLGLSVKDSNIFSSFLSKNPVPAGLFGAGGYDFPYDLKIYVPAGCSVGLDPKNGGGILNINGPQFYTVSPSFRITTGVNDSCYFIYGTKIFKDTLYKDDIRSRHKIVSKFLNPNIAPEDSIDQSLHRKLFYLQFPQCHKITLKLRDTVHPFKCESQATAGLALLPPSAKKLRIDDHFCYGYNNKVIEFNLEETKPGCMASTVWFNPDYVNTPNNWVLFNDLMGGDMGRQTFLNSKPPYAGYNAEGPNSGKFFWVYNDSILPNKSVQDINVALIIGNGVAPSECFDTVYFKNFASFPRLFSELEFVKNHAKKDNVCRNNTTYVSIPAGSPDANKLADYSAWFMVNDGGLDTTSKIEEYYYRVVDHPAYPGQKVNYTVINRYELGAGGILNLTKIDTLVTAIVHAYKAIALPGVGYKTLRSRIADLGLDINEIPDSVVLELIWNGVGTIGMPNSGSKGCIDTTGFGTEIDWYYAIQSSTILNYKDTSLLPADSVNLGNGFVKAYGFTPLKNGSYTIIRSVESYFPSWCPNQKMISLAVGFEAKVEFTDSILCQGRILEAVTNFRYYDNDDPLNETYDTTDYWLIRENEAGRLNREGFTIWDLSKEDDDISQPATIFGGFPYVIKGYGSPNILIGNQPGSIYYKTPGIYTLRVLAKDSNQCTDTFTHKIYITGPRAGFYTDIATPNCKTILELFDTSTIIDPCEQNGLPPCDFIYKWTIDWGDGAVPLEYLNQLPKQIGHDYGQNGYYEITMVIESVLGCKDTFKKIVFIPGPSPIFVPETSLFICVNDSVIFRNFTNNYTKSSQWLWNFGDGFYEPQTDTGLITHKYTQTGKFDVYLNQYDSIANSGKYCPAVYPDVKGGQAKITVVVLPYDTVKLNAIPIVVCVGDTITVNADLKTQNIYTKYNWTFGQENLQSTDLTLKVVPKRKGSFLITWMPDTIGLNSSFCPDYDSITVYADSIYADFVLSKKDAPYFCFTNRSKWAVSYRWGFYHDTDITFSKYAFEQNVDQFPPDSIICNNFINNPWDNWVCLEATNALGCKDTVCLKIINDYEMVITPPNVFTPNADAFTGKDKDGIEGNEVFNIYTKNVEYYHLIIYDRWGVKVFESYDQGYDWNGRYMNDGYNCPDGTYYYILEYSYKGRDKNEPLVNGVVRIIR